MKKLKFNPTKDMKELEVFGFKEYNDEWIRHYKNDIATFIDKKTLKAYDVDTDYKFLYNLILGSTTRCNDLIKAGLLIVESDEDDKK